MLRWRLCGPRPFFSSVVPACRAMASLILWVKEEASHETSHSFPGASRCTTSHPPNPSAHGAGLARVHHGGLPLRSMAYRCGTPYHHSLRWVSTATTMTTPVNDKKAFMELLKTLRYRTEAPLMDCSTALKEADGNMEMAMKILKKKGKARAMKKHGRETSQGFVVCCVVPDVPRDPAGSASSSSPSPTISTAITPPPALEGSSSSEYCVSAGAIITMCAETDFACRNHHFQRLCVTVEQQLAQLIKASHGAVLVDAATATKALQEATKEEVQGVVGVLGENVVVREVIPLYIPCFTATTNATAEAVGGMAGAATLQEEGNLLSLRTTNRGDSSPHRRIWMGAYTHGSVEESKVGRMIGMVALAPMETSSLPSSYLSRPPTTTVADTKEESAMNATMGFHSKATEGRPAEGMELHKETQDTAVEAGRGGEGVTVNGSRRSTKTHENDLDGVRQVDPEILTAMARHLVAVSGEIEVEDEDVEEESGTSAGVPCGTEEGKEPEKPLHFTTSGGGAPPSPKKKKKKSKKSPYQVVMQQPFFGSTASSETGRVETVNQWLKRHHVQLVKGIAMEFGKPPLILEPPLPFRSPSS